MEPRPYVLFLLSRREYPRRDLISRLVKRGVSASDAEALLDSLREEGWFRENAYAEARLRQWVRKGLGARAIEAKARSERLPIRENMIEAAYETAGSDPVDQVRSLIRKQLRMRLKGRAWGDFTKEDARSIRQKILHSIGQKGHPFTLASRIFDEEIKASSVF